MNAEQLRLADDASAGAWMAPKLGGEFGAVTLQVPSGYAAYARICHPARDEEGVPVSWSDVATATGRSAILSVTARDYPKRNFRCNAQPSCGVRLKSRCA